MLYSVTHIPRYCTDIMAVLKGLDNWMWKHLLKLDDNKIQCKRCRKIYKKTYHIERQIGVIKAHLYHKHGKYVEEDRLKWEKNNHEIWRYFDKVDLYEEKCKFCDNLLYQAYMQGIKQHLVKYHRQEITAAVRKEIENKSLSQYFKFFEEEFNAVCKRCNIDINIFYGTDNLIQHNNVWHPEDNKNVNRMIQSIVEENTGTCSHHDNINRYVPENRENQQR